VEVAGPASHAVVLSVHDRGRRIGEDLRPWEAQGAEARHRPGCGRRPPRGRRLIRDWVGANQPGQKPVSATYRVKMDLPRDADPRSVCSGAPGATLGSLERLRQQRQRLSRTSDPRPRPCPCWVLPPSSQSVRSVADFLAPRCSRPRAVCQPRNQRRNGTSERRNLLLFRSRNTNSWCFGTGKR
jgi:hypothetical protein